MGNIINYIPYGKKSGGVSRAELCRLTGNTDRANREAMEELRQEGYVICNDQDGKGYYIPSMEDIAAIKRQYARNQHRAMSILVQQKHLRKLLKDAGEI